MKLNIQSLLFFSLILLSPFLLEFSSIPSTKHSEKSNLASKGLRSLFSKMMYIEGDTFTMGLSSSFGIRMTAADSTLFTGVVPKRTIVDPYYISATEVTNGEWREFYLAKVAELGGAIGKSKFFPDTSLWLSEFPYSYNGPMARNYFSHPTFNDYPVVGITWEQANAYCRWKSKKLKTLLKKAGIQHSPEFRLPTEAEWENAAIKKEKNVKYPEPSMYVWAEEKQIGRLNDLANTGQIIDINNVVLKPYAEDGCLYTCKVASYPPNGNGLYNMAANVSEWTSDQGFAESTDLKNNEYKILSTLSEIDDEIALLKNDTNFRDVGLKNLMIESLAHNKTILSANDIKIYKGGSWASGMIYTQPGSRQGISKDNASTKIGFRLAISNVEEKVRKYFPKKRWKP